MSSRLPSLLALCCGAALASGCHDDCTSGTSNCCHARIYAQSSEANPDSSDVYSGSPSASYGATGFSITTAKDDKRLLVALGNSGAPAVGQVVPVVVYHGPDATPQGKATLEYDETVGFVENDVNHWDLAGELTFTAVSTSNLSFTVKGAKATPGPGDHSNAAKGSFSLDLTCRITDVTAAQ